MGGRRAKALSLYRAILRTARTWEGGAEEQAYIREEAGALFRKNRGATDPETIDAKLFEASSRLELGVHYQIPYPRHYYMVQGSTAKKPAPLQPLYMHSLTEDTKADLKRRTEHLRALAKGAMK
eukprot:PRCOL_00002463-RA